MLRCHQEARCEGAVAMSTGSSLKGETPEVRPYASVRVGRAKQGAWRERGSW